MCENKCANCMEQCVCDDVFLEDLCQIDCVKSYIWDTKIIYFCKKPVLKVMYNVDIFYTKNDCTKEQQTVSNSVIFMCFDKDFDICKMKATTCSSACENTCCDNVKIQTIVTVCD